MKLASRPILTQSVTTAVLFATGDTMAQQLVEKKGLEKHDLARTGRMALYGGGKLFGSSPTIAGADNTVAQLSSVPLPRPGSNSYRTKWC